MSRQESRFRPGANDVPAPERTRLSATADAVASPSAGAVGLTTRAATALLALALALGWLLVSAVPARAVTEWGVEQPGSGASVSEATYVRAYARSVQGEQVDGMRVRFRAEGGGQSGQVRDLSFASGQQQDAGTQRSTWARPFDPLASDWHGGGPMPNGRYTVEAQAVSSVDSVDFGDELHRESDWRGHQITVDAPPPATSVSAQVVDAEAGTVKVSWTASSVPDFRRYVVQRAAAGGGFSDVHTAQEAGAVSHTDTVDGDGEYRYRVRVVRAGADGERASMSEPKPVSVQGSPDDDEPADGDGGDSGGDGEGAGDSEGAGGSDDPGSPGVTSGNADPPRLSTRNEGQPTPESQGDTREPQTAPDPDVGSDFERPSGDVFEKNLDYDTPEGQPPQAAEQEGEEGGRESRDGGGRSTPRGQASEPEGSRLTVLNGRDLNSQEVLVPVAAGLVLTLGGMHVRRFLNP